MATVSQAESLCLWDTSSQTTWWTTVFAYCGWRASDHATRVVVMFRCLICQDMWYQLISWYVQMLCLVKFKNFWICFVKLWAVAMTFAFLPNRVRQPSNPLACDQPTHQPFGLWPTNPPTLWLVTLQVLIVWAKMRSPLWQWNSKLFPSQINCPVVSPKLLRLHSWTCTGTKMGWRHKNEGNWKLNWLNWTSFKGLANSWIFSSDKSKEEVFEQQCKAFFPRSAQSEISIECSEQLVLVHLGCCEICGEWCERRSHLKGSFCSS